MTVLAFTGTRSGLTAGQRLALRRVLDELHRPGSVIHLGDAVGADAEAHRIAGEIGYVRHGHPCILRSQRAFLDYDMLECPDHPLRRNRDMVDACPLEGGVLVACPSGRSEMWRGSGTWATIRYARRTGLPVIFVWPDGQIQREESTDDLGEHPVR